MPAAQFGLINLLNYYSGMFYMFALFGFSQTILKYLPNFYTKNRRHHGFIALTLRWIMIGSILTTLLAILLKPLFIKLYVEKSALVSQYFEYFIPFSVIFTLIIGIEYILIAVHKTTVSEFFKSILLNASITINLLLFAKKIIDFNQFIDIYMLIHVVVLFGILIYLIWSKQFKFVTKVGINIKKQYKEIFRYSAYSFLSGSTLYFMLVFDSFMLGAISGLEAVGVYGFVLAFGRLLTIPYKALGKIAISIIAKAWKEQNFKEIQMVFHKSALNLYIVTGIIVVGIIINENNLMYLIGNKYKFEFSVLLWVTASYLIDNVFGLNANILNISDKFRLLFYINLFALAVNVVGNYFLIKTYGILGAAISSTISNSIANFLRSFVLWKYYRLQAFNLKFLITSIFLIIVAFGKYLPKFANVWIDIFYRSAIVSVVFVALVLATKISPDINQGISKVFKMLQSKLK